MNNAIRTIQQLHTLQINTFVFAVIVVVVALALAFLVANLIPYKANIFGQDLSYRKRRTWFIILGLSSGFGFWLYNQLVTAGNIANRGWQNMYARTNLVCLIIILLGFAVAGVLTMLVSRKTKWGSILDTNKKKMNN
jgi:hypothetical protein